MNIEKLKFKCKQFKKDDLLVILLPTDPKKHVCDMEEIDTLRDELLSCKLNFLIALDNIDFKKIEFIGIPNKKVCYVEPHDDIIYVKVEDK